MYAMERWAIVQQIQIRTARTAAGVGVGKLPAEVRPELEVTRHREIPRVGVLSSSLIMFVVGGVVSVGEDSAGDHWVVGREG